MLMVVEADDAEPFVSLAEGTGVELLNSRTRTLSPSPNRDLFYVGSAEQIEEIGTADPSIGEKWSQQLIGKWHDIPIADEALDFIFAENILQRAVNPLGHLARWRAKLRSGGRILGVVPYVAGGRDYINAPTAMTNWLCQFTQTGFVETQAHHDAYAYARGLNPKSLFRRRFESSFSFFTPANIADMLNFAIDHLDYKGLHIEHVRNGSHIRFGLYC